MIPLRTGLMRIMAAAPGPGRRRHRPRARRTTPQRTTGARGRRSGCLPGDRGAASPGQHADGGGPGSAEPRCPPPCSQRIRRARGRTHRPPPAHAEPPRVAPRAVRTGRRDGSRRTGATGSTRATRGGHRQMGRSGREALTTLATAGGDDRATRTGTHPKTEAVLLVPTTVVRLERPLAHWNDSGYSRTQNVDKSTDWICPRCLSCTPSENLRTGLAGSAARNGRLNSRPIHGTWLLVDRSNRVSPDFSTGLWTG
jgi:hypothetical protein